MLQGELLKHGKLTERSLRSLARRGLVLAHRVPGTGEVYWTLTREGLQQHNLVNVSRDDARAAYLRALEDAGM